MLKYIIYSILFIYSATFAAYQSISGGSTKLGFDTPAITGSLALGESITINYADTTWYYEDSTDSSSTLNITISGDSYGEVNTITQYTPGSAAAYNDGAAFGSSSLQGANLDVNDSADTVHAESIYINWDVTFSFSNGSDFIGSTTWNIADLLASDFVASTDDISCSDSPSTAQMVIPLQTSDGTYVSAQSDSSSGYLEVRMVILNSGSPQFLVCGLAE